MTFVNRFKRVEPKENATDNLINVSELQIPNTLNNFVISPHLHNAYNLPPRIG